jgi:hypothetical protein
MSFSTRQGDPFMGPLYGRTTTFLVDSRRTNLALARTLVSSLTRNKVPCAVLDIDALYSSNSDYVFAPVSEDEARIAELLVPDPGAALEAGMADLLGTGPAKALIIDSLNSLYHLFSGGGRGSRNLNLGFAVALLSYIARTEKRAVLLTMYERERAARFGRRRSISDLSDLTVSVSMRGGELALRCERGSAWPGRGLSVSIP